MFQNRWQGPILAVLPLLGFSNQGGLAFLSGGIAAGLLLAALLLYFLIHKVIPKGTRRIFYLLLLIGLLFLAERAVPQGIFPIPILIAALLLLTAPELLEAPKGWGKIFEETLLRGGGFWLLWTAHGFWVEVGSRVTGAPFFHSPAGSYFFLGTIALVMGRMGKR